MRMFLFFFLVPNNPAMVTRNSSLIIQHSSLSQYMLPPKYEPTSDIPKFPFFMDEENASGVLRTEVIIISRKIQGTGFVVLPLKNFHWGLIHLWNNVEMHDGDGDGDKPKLELEEMHYDKPNLVPAIDACSSSLD
ncbi:uncharacterized protein [Solanum lycopersicum]|uniref:uncharacterized protein n=1 Tax=Solanum lycopersicum TaxID=4081 RepID=UPI000532D148|nr:uncharacterized protein LOC104645749 isoform X1 [Solanum lycopersicum]